MSGTLGLSSPWARQGIDAAGKAAVEARIPDGMSLGVAVTPNRAYWLLWLVEDDKPTTEQLRVSHGLPLRQACLFALEHWKVAA